MSVIEKPVFTYTNSELLEKLKRFAEKIGRTPTRREIDASADCPSSWVYYARFKSLNTAYEMVGLRPVRITRRAALGTGGDFR